MARTIATPLAPRARRPHTGPPVANGTGTLAPSVLDRVASRLLARLTVLEAQLDAGDAGAWSAYLATARTLAAILPLLAPGQRLLTTADGVGPDSSHSSTRASHALGRHFAPSLMLSTRHSVAPRAPPFGARLAAPRESVFIPPTPTPEDLTPNGK